MPKIKLILISVVAIFGKLVLASTTVDITNIVPVENNQQCDKQTTYEQSVPFGNGQTVNAIMEHMEPNQRICMVKGAKVTASESGTLTLRENGKFMISNRGRVEINGTLSVTNYLIIQDGRLLIAAGAEINMQTGTDIRDGSVKGEVNFGGESKVNIFGNLVVEKGGVLNLEGKSILNVEPLGKLEVSNVLFGKGDPKYRPERLLEAILNCLDGCKIDLMPRSSVHVAPGAVLMVKNAEVLFKPGSSVSEQGEMEVVNGTSLTLSSKVLVTYGNVISFAGPHSVVIKNSKLTILERNSGLYFRSDATIVSKDIWVNGGAHCLYDPNGHFTVNSSRINLSAATKAESFNCYASKEELKSHL